MQIDNTSAYLNDKQLAARYNVHRTRIWAWVRLGDFPPPVKLSPGCTRWRGQDVDKWEQSKAGGEAS